MKPLRPLALATMATAVLLLSGATTATALDSGDDPAKPAPPAQPGLVAPLAQHPQYVGPVVHIPAGGFAFAPATCPSGTVPTGGGGRTSSLFSYLTDSAPTPSGWEIGVRNTDPENATTAFAYVVCTVP
ncbi:hypothetical protein [Streptomyces sp. NPDC048603]|uniref:hypothetical protein n=1 Tax=Streptomyces sp. NPDC048603 TaxID=3365577 RepID=UPI003722CF4B